MTKILDKKFLNDTIVQMVFDAPDIAKKAQPGQFIILRVDEQGERVPLTIADYDRNAGTITIIAQTVGYSTKMLAKKEKGEYIADLVGPLGKPSELESNIKAAVIGGGLGCAIAYPQAKALHELNCSVDVIAGFRNKDLIILEDEMRAVSDKLIICTDDGSNGNKALVTDALKQRIEEGADYDLVIAIGPPIMMKFVSLLTKQYGIKTIVSLNPIMIDGTGMCGGCRVKVDGKIKFACVDGPDFDGHLVDFDELMRRNRAYMSEERRRDEECRLFEQQPK